MSNPIRVERDTQLGDWATIAPAGFATTVLGLGADLQVSSDGILHPDYGIIKVRDGSTEVLTANQNTCCGVHLAGPLAGDEFTLYSYDLRCFVDSNAITPFAFVAVSPASITSAAGGNVCEEWVNLKWGEAYDTEMRTLNAHGVIALPQTDAVSAGRGVCFGVGLMTHGAGAAAGSAIVHGAVRRLIDVQPAIIDINKLG